MASGAAGVRKEEEGDRQGGTCFVVVVVVVVDVHVDDNHDDDDDDGVVMYALISFLATPLKFPSNRTPDDLGLLFWNFLFVDPRVETGFCDNCEDNVRDVYEKNLSYRYFLYWTKEENNIRENIIKESSNFRKYSKMPCQEYLKNI
ncbi:Protein of unknown function, partial [Gryllus bimaculatus]